MKRQIHPIKVKYDEIWENGELVPNKKNRISERASDGEKSEMNYFKEICQGNWCGSASCPPTKMAKFVVNFFSTKYGFL